MATRVATISSTPEHADGIPSEGDGGRGDVTVAEFLSHDYDDIICGGGTAELVIAACVSENPVMQAGKNKIYGSFRDSSHVSRNALKS